MKELKFTEKNCKDTFNPNESRLNFPLLKPMYCPICNAYVDATIVNRILFPTCDGKEIGVVCYKCTHCEKFYTVTYEVDPVSKIANFKAFYPTFEPHYSNETLEPFFPTFIEAYNQSLRAESRGDLSLAAIGYRQSLESLVKDYAISELGKPREEVVTKKLFTAIEEYLGEKDLIKTADVIRILGNDYAHYERKHPDVDFQLLKRYMEIFIRLIETKMLIAHPPVGR